MYSIELRTLTSKMKKLMIRPYEQYTGLPYKELLKKKEILRKTTPEQRSPVRAAAVQYHGCRNLYEQLLFSCPCRLLSDLFFLPTGTPAPLPRTDRKLIVSGANVSSFHWRLNAYRSRCKVKGGCPVRAQRVCSAYQPPLAFHWLLYAFLPMKGTYIGSGHN